MVLDTQELVDGLRSYGVRYLSGASAAVSTPEPGALMAGLAQSSEPQLRQALVALLLVHPELALTVQETAQKLASPARDVLIEAYAAAIYLQTLWRTRLRRYLGEQPSLPALWLEELGLPSPAEHTGRLGLAALRSRNKRGGYERVAEHLFGQLLAERSHAAAAAA